MKLKTKSASLIVLVASFVFFACKKELSQVTDHIQTTVPDSISKTNSDTATLVVPYPESAPVQCEYAPDYGDSVISPQPVSGQDYKVSPLNNIGIAGQYFAWPSGLSINSGTGVIDVTKSVSGVRYAVGFVKSGATDTCLSSLIVGGASYPDSTYVMANGNATAFPYFDANPTGINPCNDPGPNQGNKCLFDIYNNAKAQGIAIDRKTGDMDLQKSVQNLMFGPLPFDGEIIYSTFYYRIADKTNNTVQQMQVEFIYYQHKSSVPASLLGDVTAKLFNIVNNVLVAKTGSPKPPLIIITRN